MTIFGRVLCPLQPSCLPPPWAARALLLLSSIPVSSVFSSFFSSSTHQNRTLFTPLLVSLSAHSAPYRSFPSSSSHSSCYCAVLSFLPKPASSAHPPSPRFTLLYCFLCSFPPHYFLCSPFLPYPSPAGSSAHPGLLHRLCTGSRVCWPLAYSSFIPVFLISPAARCTRVSKFINVRTSLHMCTDTFVIYKSVRVFSRHLHIYSHV